MAGAGRDWIISMLAYNLFNFSRDIGHHHYGLLLLSFSNTKDKAGNWGWLSTAKDSKKIQTKAGKHTKFRYGRYGPKKRWALVLLVFFKELQLKGWMFFTALELVRQEFLAESLEANKFGEDKKLLENEVRHQMQASLNNLMKV